MADNFLRPEDLELMRHAVQRNGDRDRLESQMKAADVIRSRMGKISPHRSAGGAFAEGLGNIIGGLGATAAQTGGAMQQSGLDAQTDQALGPYYDDRIRHLMGMDEQGMGGPVQSPSEDLQYDPSVQEAAHHANSESPSYDELQANLRAMMEKTSQMNKQIEERPSIPGLDPSADGPYAGQNLLMDDGLAVLPPMKRKPGPFGL